MPKKVLLVEDDPGARRLVEFTLQQAGFEVVMAKDGKEGLKVAQNEQPDAIIMDVMMPMMGGYEACLRLKEIPTTAHIPVLILTAKVQPAEKTYSTMAGADDFLTKPAEPDVIVARVKKLLESRRTA